jgi:hypothetical protein
LLLSLCLITFELWTVLLFVMSKFSSVAYQLLQAHPLQHADTHVNWVHARRYSSCLSNDFSPADKPGYSWHSWCRCAVLWSQFSRIFGIYFSQVISFYEHVLSDWNLLYFINMLLKSGTNNSTIAGIRILTFYFNCHGPSQGISWAMPNVVRKRLCQGSPYPA